MTFSSHDHSDEVLLAGFAASDPAATAAFVERFQRRVYGLAVTVVGDARAAEDVAQEALLRAWRHGGVYDARRGSVVTWLLTITRNAAIDSVRVRRPIAIDPDDLPGLSPSDPERDPGDVAAVYDDLRADPRGAGGVARGATPRGRARRRVGLEHARDRRTGRDPAGNGKDEDPQRARRLRVALDEHEHRG